ncbi:MAG: dihydroorotase family protein [Nitrosopumilus sp.]|nr:dihydroorotase family protein [Nitrosopumilus sp.]MDA7943897.1 dihydroorotase family protein [Nitrosopumilus sp.]MDA7953482.1 dihydroorotase family protein [Nitrosopumilus sp.]MDA7958796.1 dihydroorotase family protein [Nitrosopumilus sp.]MDA7959931.1 dihydroorotase family protein [Nitrosopumilus sp.]
MTYDLVVAGARVVTPSGTVERNVLVKDGLVAGLSSAVPECGRLVRADGLVAVPGMIDPHMHYGVYSPVDEAARTESRVAAAGGTTTMMRMLRLGVPFEEGLPAQLEAASRSHLVDYAVHASVFDEGQIAGMGFCAKMGVTSFKIYMNLGGEVGHVYMDQPPGHGELVGARVEVSPGIVEGVVERAASLGCPVLVHAEDYEACGCGMKEARGRGLDGLGAWSESRPPDSEAKAIRQVCAAARRHGCAIYVVHVGSRLALEQVRRERALGTEIRAETCPHYLALTHEGRGGYLAKVMPPIRTRADSESAWGAVRDGTIDAVGTDHVANRLSLKDGSDVWESLAGFPGSGTMAPLLLHHGVNAGRITIEDFARLTSGAAARIFGLAGKGRIEEGADADIVLLDLRTERRVEAGMFGGYSDYDVYEGQVLRGWPAVTISRGEVVSEGLDVHASPGRGRLVPRLRGS